MIVVARSGKAPKADLEKTVIVIDITRAVTNA
jgi:hypothetical protein